MNDASNARPVQLHVIHDLGGGSAKWLADYIRADQGRTNLVLKSFTFDDAAGGGLALYSGADDSAPIKAWRFSTPIPATVVSHAEYRAALDEVVAGYGVAVLVVSSLIGHSLEVLETGLPTVVVNHDYFPYCPSINLYFGSVCDNCDDRRIASCERENPDFNPFVGFTAEERARVRRRYLELVTRPGVLMVVPSRSVAENLLRLDPAFSAARFETVPHGYGLPLEKEHAPAPGPGRLRVLVLGQMSVAKGVRILEEALPRLARIADIYLIGPRELGELFRFEPHVHVISQYDIGELPRHVAAINPHVGVLASIVPETFSYALSELQMLGVPVAATAIGSFPERIRAGETGYLFAPTADALAAQIEAIDQDRGTLEAIRARLQDWKPRSAEEMVADYHRLAPVRAGSPRPPKNAAAAPMPMDPQLSTTIAQMWKEVRRTSLQLSIVNEARARERSAEETRQRELHEHIADLEEAVGELRRAEVDRKVHLVRKEGEISDRDREIQRLAGQIQLRDQQVAEILGSTSWKVSRPVRWAGGLVLKGRKLGRAARAIAGNPSCVRDLSRAWRTQGYLGFKKALVALEPGAVRDPWEHYRQLFRRHVRPKIVQAVSSMERKPLISVLLPTYETPEPLLRETLESVRAQLYPRWELCVVDDGSQAPHVAQVLAEYALRDPRIKVKTGGPNQGVSKASNEALEMATGEFTVLLDHDDVLEEQALFRFAECIVQDDPDVAYGDEILPASAATVTRYAFRPAFSPEYLRSHPYIVHPVAFRTSLLRRIGAFDPALRISQDYDLILRATDAANRVVHIPEVLYVWRQHPESSGQQQASRVMETSKAVLRKHVERAGLDATVDDGATFNLFDVRYPLQAGTRVAVIIPTKNHGELLRQCIESLKATVKEVAYDIVVIDHDSTEPETRAYLESLEGTARVIPYSGEFNFSAINNFAVRRLGGAHSHYLFCNNDIEALDAGWLERMVELAQQPSVGIVGAQLLYPDRKSIQHGGVLVGAFGAAEHYAKRLRFGEDLIEPGYAEMLQLNHEVSAVTAACMLIRRDAFDVVGGFDDMIKVGFGDVDLCLRAGAAGYRVLFCPHARLVHHESYTRGTSLHDPHPEDSALFRRKWRALLEAGDPYYHPSLSLTSSNWSPVNPLPCRFELRRRIVDIDRAAGRQKISFSG